jgi:DNA-binding PadR family transcriptional regulator
MPSRLLGFYALSVMESEGALYGYMLADRIAERTEGGWRPGAGAIYPALESLTRRKLARPAREGRRRIYRITPAGRGMLKEVRRNISWRAAGGPDLSRLWAEIAGPSDPDQFLLDAFRRRLDAVVAHFTGGRPGDPVARARRAQLREDLERAVDPLRRLPPVRSRSTPPTVLPGGRP